MYAGEKNISVNIAELILKSFMEARENWYFLLSDQSFWLF